MPSMSRSPRHTRRLAAILAVTAVAAPAALAGPAHAVSMRDSGPANNAAVASAPLRDSGAANNGFVTSSLAGTTAPVADRGPVADPGPVPVRTVTDGFDWAAAGIGAGSAAAFALLGLAGMQARTRTGTHLAG